ncbi:helix-turn-helix domain-containing protein [uncultured Porphyromonas sp.]|uniref:helix-turn-helix domain-containing protein n=1 Tax=uncultured Porphyromonas sp. TaxID=159274 RepID=UPI00259A4B96|nr:helix-turn-helix domain-containing protein [uncultured Porphyromonas sp.]
MDSNMLLQELTDLVRERLMQKEMQGADSQPFEFTNSELIDVLGVSKSTLYRFRREEKLKYKKQGNQISYDYKDLMDAIQDGRIKIKGLTKLSAMEKITNYKKLVQLGFEVKKEGILGVANVSSEPSDITITRKGV